MPTCTLRRVDGGSVGGDRGRAALGELLRVLWEVDGGEGGVRVHSTPVTIVCRARGDAHSTAFDRRVTVFTFPLGARWQCGHFLAHSASRSVNA